MKGAVLGAAAISVRVVRSRHRRFLHPDGRSFPGELVVWGTGPTQGADLLDRPGRHSAVVRISKGIGTRGGRPDIRGVAVRVEGEHPLDLLFSTAGEGRFTRHLPAPRRTFDTFYGSILAYRTGTRRKVYLSARPESPLGRTLTGFDDGSLLLSADDRAFGRVSFGSALSADEDAALAFDPVRHTAPDLHPTGFVHSSRALAYRLSQRWRGAQPAEPAPSAVERTAAHR
ncbi:hypothetical protein M1L60_20905 [Actinoplanes sp. TRM 88003]|uniref:Phosphodiesterase n=1 Tax=Paractinoplanes aksuensis TaxID=2939490 RepID=A0ABT1DRE1_9ACTN|nr:hypothetical protein [Actinoplanes aksuensis]MCO8273058.1 hypothetical protein [Actinoplanes aksuensis]